jgi:hypothetical protein
VTARKPKRAAQLGVTDEQYERLLAAQGGHCALCPSTPKTRRLHVDHDHRTGLVRGLLCHRCNRGIPTWITAGWLGRAMFYMQGRGTHPIRTRSVLDEINGIGKDGAL